MKTSHCRAGRLWQVVVAALLVTLGTIANGANPAHAASMVPLRASFAGTAAFTSSSTVHFSGTGISTLLGLIKNDGQVTITGLGASCPDGPTGAESTNVETLTAANGDKLVITSYDVACQVAPLTYHGTGQWMVNGDVSTGRFSGATGAGTLDGFSHFDVGTFTIQITGQISAPNSR